MKKRMAFVDLTNFKDWPAGGMLQYELAILPFLATEFDLDIWGVSVDRTVNRFLTLNGSKYPVNIWGNARTESKLIPNYWRGLELLLKKEMMKKYDIIYVHTGSCAVAISKIIDRTKTLLVYHQHGLSHLNDHALMSLIQRPFVNRAQYTSDVVFIVSDKASVENYYEMISHKVQGRVVPIGSPIDLSLFPMCKKSKREETLKLIYTGRIDEHKSVCTLIEVVNNLNKIYPQFSLTILGDGSEKEKVVARIKELGLEDKVILKGVQPRNKVLQELLLAGIYITASIGEGVSISVLEAHASGLPVVCFDVPGLSKQVINNVTGRVIPDRNIDLMAKAIVEINEAIEWYSQNALDEFRKYDAKEIANKIIKNI